MCSIMGVHTQHQSILDAFLGLIGASIFFGAIFIYIGYWLGQSIGNVQKKSAVNNDSRVEGLYKFSLNPNTKISPDWNGRFKKFVYFVAVIVVCVVGAGYFGRQQARESYLKMVEKKSLDNKASSDVINNVVDTLKPIVVKSLPISDGFTPNVLSLILPFDKGIDAFVSDFRDELTNESVNDLRESRPSKLKAILEYNSVENGRILHSYIKAEQKGETICLTTATATATQWPKIAAEFKACVDSFEPK